MCEELIYDTLHGKHIAVFKNVKRIAEIKFVADSENELERKIRKGYPMGLASFRRARRLQAQKDLKGKPPSKMNKKDLVEYGKLKGVVIDPELTKKEMLDKLI